MTHDPRELNAPVLIMTAPDPSQQQLVRTLMACIRYLLVKSGNKVLEVTQEGLNVLQEEWDLHASTFGDDGTDIRLRVSPRDPEAEKEANEAMPPFPVFDLEGTPAAAHALHVRDAHKTVLN